MVEILQDRYEIKQQLAKKAGRRTLLAHDRKTQQSVIIKLLTFSSDFTWEDLKLFEREAQTLKTLDHPAIPSYIDYFEFDSGATKGYALVQSYVKGQSLEEYIKAGRKFTETEVKQIAKSLLEILIFLHSRQPPVIHRDIKPSNIILKKSSGSSVGQIYLVDFGSVQTLINKAGNTVTVVGTYGYMPPEQFGGYAKPASDLYSLGATSIALASGMNPGDLPQKDLRIDFSDAVDLSPGLVDWLHWLTEPSLERRLPSATIALEVLKTGLIKTNQRSGVIQRPVDSLVLLGNALWRSTWIGGLVVTSSAAIYGTFIFPGLGTIFAGQIGAMIGFPIAFANGFLAFAIARLFFFPLKNAHLYRRTVTMLSTILGTAAALIAFSYFKMVGSEASIVDQLFWKIAPSVITGLSMGAASKSIAKWYEEQHSIIQDENE